MADATITQEPKPAPPPPCPTCKGERDAKLRCWKCQDRTCAICHERLTGSPFIGICILCQAEAARHNVFVLVLRAGADRAQRRRHMPDRRPIYRLKLLIKRACRDYGFDCSWGAIPPPVPTTGAPPECPEEEDDEL